MRVFCLEDNPLIALHVEQMIEDLGHVAAGTLGSFAELKKHFASLEMDGALVDIDLSDGRTGPQAAMWLKQRGVPTIFVTGQSELAYAHQDVSIAVVAKPVSQVDLGEKIALFKNSSDGAGSDRKT